MFKKKYWERFSLETQQIFSLYNSLSDVFNFVKLDSVPTKMRTELTLHHQQRSALQCTEENNITFNVFYQNTLLPKKQAPTKTP